MEKLEYGLLVTYSRVSHGDILRMDVGEGVISYSSSSKIVLVNEGTEEVTELIIGNLEKVSFGYVSTRRTQYVNETISIGVGIPI